MTLAPHDVAAAREQAERHEADAARLLDELEAKRAWGKCDPIVLEVLESRINGHLADAAEARRLAAPTATEEKPGEKAAEDPQDASDGPADVQPGSRRA